MTQAANNHTAAPGGAAQLTGSGTGEPKPVFSLLMASLAQTAMALGVFWVIAVLFGAGHLLEQVPPAAALAAAAGCFAASHLLLRNRRPLLFLLAADVLLAGGAAWVLRKVSGLGGTAVTGDMAASSGAWITAVTVFLAVSILFGLLSQLKWECSRFSDSTMMLQLQVLFVIGIMQIWIAEQMKYASAWIAPTFLMAAGLLAGLVAVKVSGLHAGKTGGGILSRSGPIAAALAFCGLAIGGAIAFAEPVGRLVSQGYKMMEGLLASVMTVVGKILGFLFMRNRVRLDQGGSSSDGTGTGNMEYVPTEEGDFNFFRTLFHITCILVLIMLVVAAIRLLLQITVGTGISMARRRHSRIEQQGTLWERLQAFIREVRQQIHGRKLLRQHPSSVAALIVWLESQCSRNEELRRQPGETVRNFLFRLAEHLEPEQPGATEILRNLADAADRACYSREGNLLTEFGESEAIRGFFHKNP